MAGYQDLATSEWVMGVQAEAVADYETFAETGEAAALLRAVRALCNGLERLGSDQSFWAALIDFERMSQEENAALNQRMGDVDGMIEIERKVFHELHLNEQQINRLISDLANALRLAGSHREGPSITNLQERVRALQQETCDQSDWIERQLQLPIPQHPNRRGLFRVIRVVVKAIVVLGGATLSVADVIVGVHGVIDPQTVFDSITAGVGLINHGLEMQVSESG